MLTVRIGKIKMARRQSVKGRIIQCILVGVSLIIFVTVILKQYSDTFKVDLHQALSEGSGSSVKPLQNPKQPADLCVKKDCPADHYSFYIHSGAANVVSPNICLQNKLVLGKAKDNAGTGLNIVVLNGKSGEVTKTDHFDMYSGDVKPLIEFLQSIEKGSIVLIASFDDPSSKLNEDAKKLIAELGSSAAQSLGFRDSWVFVGGKGATVQSNFEKVIKNNPAKNKYQQWPELIEMHGCIPKYME
uniref:ILEI/PANDER domain-containing protein n=2 Tax=Sphaeramia orbicularis TaxID=375764 RepID=A0A672YS48_9TELE